MKKHYTHLRTLALCLFSVFLTFSLQGQALPEFESYPYTQLYNWGTSSYASYQYDIPNSVSPMRFRLMTPPAPYDRLVSDGRKYPLIIFLHGSGEAAPYDANPDDGSDSQDNELQLVHGGQTHKNAVLSGKFPGLLLYPQIRRPNPALGIGPAWGFDNLEAVERIVRKLIQSYKVDPDRIYIHGLSMGGEGTWRFLAWRPDLFAAAHPMSAANSIFWNNVNSSPAGFWTGQTMQRYKHIPLRLSQGALDTGPTPAEGNAQVVGIRSIGANIRYSYYPTLGHGTWNNEYGKADFFSWLLSHRKNNIHVYDGQTSFCSGQNFSVTMGLTPGFADYQWTKNDTTAVPFKTGASANETTVTQVVSASSGVGTYYARFQRSDGTWTRWSAPVVIDNNRGPSTTPSISANGKSVNLPALDGSAEVILYGTAGKQGYTWSRDAVSLPQTTQNVTVGTAGAYVLRTQDPAETGYETGGVIPTEFRALTAGCLSLGSAPVIVTTQNGFNVPAPPANFFANATSLTSITLNWDDRSNNETGFEIYRSIDEGNSYTLVTILPASAAANPRVYVDNNLLADTTYVYRMRAVNTAGGSAYTPAVTVNTGGDTTPPTSPVLTVGATSRTEINLSWASATDNVGVYEYDLYQNGALITTLTTTSYKVTGVTAFAVYNYVVKARDVAGNVSPPSNQVNPVAVNPGLFYSYYHHASNLTTVNQILTNGTLIKTGIIAQFRLDPRTRNDGFAFIYDGFINIPTSGNYTFFTSSDDGSYLTVNNTPVVTTNDATHGCQERSGVINLSAGTYPIRVLMFENGGGECLTVRWQGPGIAKAEIPASFLRDTYTPPAALNAPSNFSSTAPSFDQINLTWNDNSNNETGFEISRATPSSSGTYQVVHVTAAGATSWQNTGLSPNTQYHYKIRAISATSASALVGPISRTTPGAPSSPAVPSGLSASAPLATQVNLTWNDNSTVETGYEIQKSSSNVSATFVTIATVGANVTGYSDEQVNGHATVYYRVRAIRTGATPSGFSNVASVTTPNRAPVIHEIPNQTLLQNSPTPQIIKITVTDPDTDPISFAGTEASLPTGATLTSDGYGNGQIAFVSTAPGVYNITVMASDGLASDTEELTVTVGTNQSPTLAFNPADFNGSLVIEEGRTATLIITATDPTGTIVDPRPTLTNMPAFAATPGWNNTTKVLTLTFTPAVGDASINENISVTFSDGLGGMTTYTFTVIAVPIDPFYTISVNLVNQTVDAGNNYNPQNYVESAPWNTLSQDQTISNLKDDGGNIVRFITASASGWTDGHPRSVDLPFSPTAVYTEKVRESFLRRGSGVATVTFQNLNPEMVYKVTVFGAGPAAASTAQYILEGATNAPKVTLNNSLNTSTTASTAFVAPKANGTIDLRTSRETGFAGNVYLNAVILTGFYDYGTPPDVPTDLTLFAPNNESVQISWRDVSFNETKFEVFRASSSSGPWSSVGEVAENDTSMIDNNVVGRTSYYYKVRAYNDAVFSETSPKLITTPNGVPVLESLSTIVIQSGTVLQLNISATDPEDDQIEFSVLNLPVFANLVDNGDGTGFIRFVPLASDVGSYNFTVRATDNFAASTETGGFLVVQDSQYEEVVFLNFNGGGANASNAPSPWNNIGNHTVNATALLNSTGATSVIDFFTGPGWTSSSNTDGVNTGANAGIYPDNVIQSFWTTNITSPSSGAQVQLANLSDTKRYNITLFGSRDEYWFSTTEYVINGVTRTLVTGKNTDNAVKFAGIQPTAGVITITVRRAPNENASPLVEHEPAVLNALIVESYTPGANPIKPGNLKAEGISTSAIRLTWVDNSSDETGFEIYRTSVQGGADTLIHTTAANIQTYTNSGLGKNKAYIYRIRAIKPGGASGSTNQVFASTYNQVILVNINGPAAAGHLQAPLPWNNLATSAYAGATFGPFRNDSNVLTTVGMQIINWETGGTNNTGYLTGNNSGVYPDAVLDGYYYFEQSDPAIEYVLTGVNNNQVYDMVFMGNEWSTIATIGGLPVITDFKVGTETVTQFNGKNTTETVSIKGILPEGGTIPFQVSQNAAGRYGVWNSLEIRSYTSLNTVFDQEPPTIPQALAVTDTTDVTVDLAWNESTDNSGIAGYEVFQGSSLVATVDTIIAHITGLQPSTLYTFSVRAYDIKGNRSPFSTSIQVMTEISSTTAINYYPTLAPVFDMTNPAHWSNNPNGSGSIPSGFDGNNQHFVLTRNATIDDALTITGSNSKLIVSDNMQLVVNDILVAPVDLGDNASIIINTPTAPELATLSPTSTATFNGTSNTIPGANYGNLALEGAGSTKSFQTGTYSINGNLQIGNDITVNGASGNGTVVNLAGDLIFQGAATMGSDDERIGVNFISRGSQDLIAEQTDIALFQLRVSDTTEVNVVSTTPRTITLGSATPGAGLVLDSSAVFNLGNHTLQLEGTGAINQDNNSTGRMKVSKGTIRINSSNQVSNLYFVAGSDTIKALHVNSSPGQINIRSKMNIVEVLDVNNGTVNSQGNIVLLSDADGTAWIGPIRNNGLVNGSIEFQRHFEAKGKVYRYVSTPLHGTRVIDWMPYFQITGAFQGGNGTASLFYYDEPNGGYIAFPSENSLETFTLGTGYSLYAYAGNLPRKLRINGPILQGNFDYPNLAPGTDPGSNDGWNLLGNPYAAPIQWGNSGWIMNDINSTVAVRDNRMVNGVLNYDFKYWNGLDFDDDANDLDNGIIAQGQAFWIKSNGASPSLQITEDAKYDTLRASFYRRAVPDNYVIVTLRKGTLADKTIVHFTPDATALVDAKGDAIKMSNSYFNLSTLAGDKNLAINTLPEAFCEKYIALNIRNAAAGQYTLDFRKLSTFDYTVDAKLVDRFAQTETVLSEGSVYTFDITSDPASSGSGRFELIVSKPTLDESVAFASASGSLCDENGSLQVTLTNTQPGVRYTVLNGTIIIKEHSGTGGDVNLTLEKSLFESGDNTLHLVAGFPGCDVKTLSTTSLVQYIAKPVIAITSDVLTSSSATGNQWYLEGNPIPGATGTTFMPEFSGEYSVVVSGETCAISSDPVLFAVTAAEEAINGSFTLFPNPVKARFTIRLKAIPAGENIDVRIYNSLGQLMDKQKHIYQKEGVELNGAPLKAGVYTIVVETRQQKFERRMLKE